MDNLPLNYHPWSDRLAMDIALLLEGSGESMTQVIARHNISETDMARFTLDKMFLKKIDHLRGEVRDRGMTFRLKAKSQAEELLTTSWQLIHSADVSASVKADLIKWTGKMAGLEPVRDAVVSDGQGGGVNIVINLSDPPRLGATEKVINHGA